MKLILVVLGIGAIAWGCVSGDRPARRVEGRATGLWPEDTRGTLFIIGGGERTEELMGRFVALGGGSEARVLIVPFASSYVEETGRGQSREMMAAGADTVYYVNCAKEELDHPRNLVLLDSVTAVFFSGGDQNRLAAYLKDTEFFRRIVEIYRRGGVVGGTSAGAAVMSRVMITGRENFNEDEEHDFEMIRKGNVQTDEGFGFITSAVIDQHFIKRKRQNRLLNVLLDHPGLTGIGIDEATAIIVHPDGMFEVAGESGVMVFEKLPDDFLPPTDKNGHPAAGRVGLKLLIAGDTCRIN